LNSSFNLGFADDNGQIIGTFNLLTFSGYITSGFIVIDEVCFYNSSVCKIVRVFLVDTVLADQWFYGINGGFGIVGVGPGSPFVR